MLDKQIFQNFPKSKETKTDFVAGFIDHKFLIDDFIVVQRIENPRINSKSMIFVYDNRPKDKVLFGFWEVEKSIVKVKELIHEEKRKHLN